MHGYSPSNPSIARTDGSPPRRETWETTCVLCDAQAACGFSCSASKRSSFFQSVKAMAAIFRAKVRRAISGFMPLATQTQIEVRVYGTHPAAGSRSGDALKISFISWS